MILNDNDARNKLNNVLSELNDDNINKEIITNTLLLLNEYSYVNNQTYPRPSHPFPEKRSDAYFTLIAILLSLRTTLENETKATINFMANFNSIDEVLTSDVNTLAEIIKCAGMPLKKAETILKVSKYIKDNYNGDINNILDSDINTTRNRLMDIPGVGQKSADCMLELAFDLPSMVIDTNIFRVFSRYYFNQENMQFTNEKHILSIKKFIEDNLLSDFEIYQIVHTIMLLNGKFICKANPNCLKCLINENCAYNIQNNHDQQLSLFK